MRDYLSIEVTIGSDYFRADLPSAMVGPWLMELFQSTQPSPYTPNIRVQRVRK